jgi:hypothetical protein
MSKPKITLTKGNDVKRTKSEQLAALLQKDGWKRETSGGDKKDTGGKGKTSDKKDA